MSLSKIEANDILELIRNHLDNFLSKKLNLPLDVITKAATIGPYRRYTNNFNYKHFRIDLDLLLKGDEISLIIKIAGLRINFGFKKYFTELVKKVGKEFELKEKIMTDLLSRLIDEINTKMKDEQPTTYSSSDNDLPLSVNNKLSDNPGAAQLTASFSQTDFDDLGMGDEELLITEHSKQTYGSGNGINGGSLTSSSSSYKGQPSTTSQHPISIQNHNSNASSSQQQRSSSLSTFTHYSQWITPQGVLAPTPHSSKLSTNTNLSSPLMMSNNNSTTCETLDMNGDPKMSTSNMAASFSQKDFDDLDMGDEELLITEHLNQAYASGNGMSNNNSTTCETLDMNGDPKTSTSNMASSLSSTLQMTNSLQTSNTSYNSSANQQLKESWNNPNQGHTSKPMNHINLSSQYTQFQNINRHHRMLGPPRFMPPQFNPHQPSDLPPSHPYMYQTMPSHRSMDPSGMMMSHPGGPSRSSQGLPPSRSSQRLPPSRSSQGLPPSASPSVQSSNPMQQYLHYLPPSHDVTMHNIHPLMGPPPGHQQAPMRFPVSFPPVMDNSSGTGPPHHHPHMHPPPHPMYLNDGLPPPQAINNVYGSATMSVPQLNIRSLGPCGLPSELEAGTIHYYAPSGNVPYFQQQQLRFNNPQSGSQLNDLQTPSSNLSVDGSQPPPYW